MYERDIVLSVTECQRNANRMKNNRVQSRRYTPFCCPFCILLLLRYFHPMRGDLDTGLQSGLDYMEIDDNVKRGALV